MVFKIWQAIGKERIERLWVGDIWPTGLAVYLVSIFSNKPYIISAHGKDLLLVKRSKVKGLLARTILKQAVAITVNSQSTGRIVESFGVAQEKIKVIYPGVDIQKYNLPAGEAGNTGIHPPVRQAEASEALRVGEYKKIIIEKYGLAGKNILLSVGRLVERKGFDKVIEALPEIAGAVENLVYVIVGEGPDRQRLGQKITKSQNHKNIKIKDRENNNPKIIFTGEVSEDEKLTWLELCDVFIMPARESRDDVEGFGIVYLEAGMADKPVVAGKSGGASEAVVDGQTGILIDPERTEEVAGAVIKLLKDGELRKEMGENGRGRAEKYFNWGISGKKMEEILS